MSSEIKLKDAIGAFSQFKDDLPRDLGGNTSETSPDDEARTLHRAAGILREKMALYPVIHPIGKNLRTARFLKKSSLYFTSIPSKGEMVTLYNRVALAPGGIIETLDKESMHEQNRNEEHNQQPSKTQLNLATHCSNNL